MFLGKVLNSILRLYVLQLGLVYALQFVDFVDAEHNWDGSSCCCHYIVHLLFPVSSVLNRLHTGDIANHDDSIGFTAKIPIQTVVTSVHAHKIPDVQSDLIASNVHNLGLELWTNGGCVVRLESVTDKAINNGGFAHRRIA